MLSSDRRRARLPRAGIVLCKRNMVGNGCCRRATASAAPKGAARALVFLKVGGRDRVTVISLGRMPPPGTPRAFALVVLSLPGWQLTRRASPVDPPPRNLDLGQSFQTRQSRSKDFHSTGPHASHPDTSTSEP